MSITSCNFAMKENERKLKKQRYSGTQIFCKVLVIFNRYSYSNINCTVNFTLYDSFLDMKKFGHRQLTIDINFFNLFA